MVQEVVLTDGIDTFRIQARDGVLATDQAITPLGFDGIEDLDWENWEKIPPI
jgi:hypothetical protein